MDTTRVCRFLKHWEEAEAIVFDLDGTLVERMPYEEVLVEVAAATGVELQRLIDHYNTDWKGLEEALTYHTSLAQTDDAKRLIHRSYEYFAIAKRDTSVLPCSVFFFAHLRDRRPKVSRICWTRGDEALQRATIDTAVLEAYFDHIVCVPVKNRATAATHLLPIVLGKQFIIVGDRYDQDIAPLADAATAALWISGSKANQYVPRPGFLEENVLEVPSLECFYDLERVLERIESRTR